MKSKATTVQHIHICYCSAGFLLQTVTELSGINLTPRFKHQLCTSLTAYKHAAFHRV